MKVQVEAKSEGPPASGRPWETVDDVKRAGFFPLQVGRWDSVRPLGSFAGWPQAVQAHDATGFFFSDWLSALQRNCQSILLIMTVGILVVFGLHA